jgi:hypothetical protein
MANLYVLLYKQVVLSIRGHLCVAADYQSHRLGINWREILT